MFTSYVSGCSVAGEPSFCGGHTQGTPVAWGFRFRFGETDRLYNEAKDLPSARLM
jgi:hypothetical protein